MRSLQIIKLIQSESEIVQSNRWSVCLSIKSRKDSSRKWRSRRDGMGWRNRMMYKQNVMDSGSTTWCTCRIPSAGGRDGVISAWRRRQLLSDCGLRAVSSWHGTARPFLRQMPKWITRLSWVLFGTNVSRRLFIVYCAVQLQELLALPQ